MQDFSLSNVREGMDLCDVNGNKVGTISQISRIGRSVGATGTLTGNEGYLHVDTGFLGLGKDLYVPFSAIRNCNDDCCFLNIPKDNVDRMGWDNKPSNLV